MAVLIRKLEQDDLGEITKLGDQKLSVTDTPAQVFTDLGNEFVFKYFVLPSSVVGGENKLKCFGYFEDDRLIGVLGLRTLEDSPGWVLSFIITDSTCKNSISVITDLTKYAISFQENLGYFQWFVISKLEKFDVWQRLFLKVRSQYHHYIYARVKANELPQWFNIMQLSRGKIFPYDINVSMYISKKLCTSGEAVNHDSEKT